MNPFARHSLAFVLALALTALAVVRADDSPLTYKQKGEAFLAHLEKAGIDAETLAEIKAEWKRIQDEEDTVDFIAESLIKVDERLRGALEKIDEDFLKEATESFQAILDASPDNYTRAVATFEIGKAHFKMKNWEQAEPFLEKAARELAPYHQSEGEALFYFGSVQAALVKREEATKTLTEFLEKYPSASERYRSNAETLRATLIERGENELLDIADRMEIVRSLLDKSKTGEPTQKKQDEIVEILDELIKKHEQECKNCSGKGSGGGQGRGQGQGGGQGPARGTDPSNPANGMGLPTGSVDDPMNPDDGSASNTGDGWNKLRDKERQEILDRISKGMFPERYKALLEQFHGDGASNR